VAGAASAKHALSLGTRSALVPNGPHTARSLGPSTLAYRSGAKPRVLRASYPTPLKRLSLGQFMHHQKNGLMDDMRIIETGKCL
jgi:hypothetical protein